MSLSKLRQVILLVRDLPAAVNFYRDLLGMKVKYTVPDEFVFLDGGAIELALRATDSAVTPGLTELVFQVDDVFATYEALKSRGLVFSGPPRAVTGSEKASLFATDFRDPDGHVLSITSWVSKEWGRRRVDPRPVA
jgi:catechol 2,3-dioxygenase-like lactoylglutathione lyase family enzyme